MESIAKIKNILDGINKRVIVTDVDSYYILKEHFSKEISKGLSKTAEFRTKYDVTVMYVPFDCLRDFRGLKIDLLILPETDSYFAGVSILRAALLKEVLLYTY